MNTQQVIAALRSERKRRRLSLRQVHEAGGPSISQISQAERGLMIPSNVKLEAWANALDMDFGLRLAPRITTPIVWGSEPIPLTDQNMDVLTRIVDGLRRV